MKTEALKDENGTACLVAIEKPADIASYIIQCHDGDANAAVEALMDEIEHLQEQLSIAVAAMGRGYTRGWTPPIDRPEN